MSRISPLASIVHSHMYKSWIRNNPELALERIEEFCRECKERGMMLRYFEDEHYVDIVAAYKESDLDMRYA
jgi:hypothetical protein